jgi:hypothetical protein
MRHNDRPSPRAPRAPLSLLTLTLTLTLSPLSLTLPPPAPALAGDLQRETLGEVGVGIPFAYVLRLLGSPNKSSKALYDDQAKCTAQVHFYEKRGIEVETCGEGRNPPVRSVRAVHNRSPVTSKGLRVGDKGEEVLKRYEDAKSFEGKTYVIEDTRSGISMRFLVEEGLIYEINLYKDHTLPSGKVDLEEMKPKQELFR